MSSPAMAALIAEALSRKYPAYLVRVIRWDDNTTIRYEAVARDLAASRTAVVITSSLPELIRALRAG